MAEKESSQLRGLATEGQANLQTSKNVARAKAVVVEVQLKSQDAKRQK